jgi:hypothetical protein
MKTFDLFHTLAASRHNLSAGEVPIEEHIPIAENIARVKPEDIVVSDYHTPAKAQRILTEVCGLSNVLVCTEDGKATGRVWGSVKSEHHLGDNVHTDFNSPRANGVSAELTMLWQLTDREKACGDLGWAMREARLRTWNYNQEIRGLQLHQIERNFPFLFAVAHKLHTHMIDGGYERLQLCSRDCFLLYRLMRKLFGGKYVIGYFLTSRLTRYRPSDSYTEYAREALCGKTLVVDMNGSGNSLRYMTEMMGGTPLLVCGCGQAVPFLMAGGIRETSNLAPHAMISDVVRDENGDWKPVYLNSTNQDWVKPTIMEPQKAFLLALECLERHKLGTPSYSLESAQAALEHFSLAPLWPDHLEDSKAAYDLLNSGPLPHSVIL